MPSRQPPPRRPVSPARGTRATRSAPDVVVIGAGLVGLSCTLSLAERGLAVLLLADVRVGEASPAAGGILAPSVDPVEGAAHQFAVAARDRYPRFVASLAEHTGIEVPLHQHGVLHLAETEEDAAALTSQRMLDDAEWVDRGRLAELEPSLVPMPGGILYPHDGMVNNLVLMRALKARVGRHPRVTVLADGAEEIGLADGAVSLRTRMGGALSAGLAVLAGGSWTPLMAGLPRALPVEPVRGQMLSVAAHLVNRPVIGRDGYLIPRGDGRTLLGGTMERVGYEPSTTPEGLALVRGLCEAICPATRTARTLNGWAGLRPMTPDALPVIDRDPAAPQLIYATGHSRNGVLLAPLTGEAVAELAIGAAPEFDLAPFRVDRFPS